MRSRIWSIIAAILLVPPGASAADEPPVTDANVITALDVSASIMRHEEWLEVEGLAKAVASAPVLDAIAGGRHGRIGFAVLTWSSGGRFEVVVPWTLIGSADDAERVATALRGFALERGSGGSGRTAAQRTDISAAIDFAARLALAAPAVSQRTVVNVCANGADNVAAEPRAARDRALAAGIVLNGLVIGERKGLAGYLREHVQGGAGSFVLEVTQPAALADAMVDKLLRDLVADRPPTGKGRPRPPLATGQVPIAPPSSLVITTSDGRGGTPAAKSGQRVVGLSKVEA